MGKENMKNCLSWINFYNPTDDWYYLKKKDKTTYLKKYAKVVELIEKLKVILEGYDNKNKSN